jgi:hypothetical protein
MKPQRNIIDVMQDADLFGKWFKPKKQKFFGRAIDSFHSWRVFLAALFALPMTEEQRAVYTKHTGRTDVNAKPYREAHAICGRRAGKSLVASAIAVFVACFCDHSAKLQAGEVGVVMVIAASVKQAGVIFGYIDAFLQLPILRKMVVNQTKDSIELAGMNGTSIRIEVYAASPKTVRGYTVLLAIADELCFWPSDVDAAASADETLNALRPAMLTTGGTLLCISSPYARRGPMWNAYKNYYGQPGTDVLVWKATTREMNETVPLEDIEKALRKDRAAASAEYLAEFRTDVESFLSLELVEGAMVRDRLELRPIPGEDYFAFADPSGGSSDSFTLAVAHYHKTRGVGVLDKMLECSPPFSPSGVVRDFSIILKRFNVSEVVTDRYGGRFPVELFAQNGITVRASERSKSDIYLEVLAGFTSGKVELLDSTRLTNQLTSLERRTRSGGKDIVDHPNGFKDDLANSVCGALLLVLENSGDDLSTLAYAKSERAAEIKAEGLISNAMNFVKDIFDKSTANPRAENIDRKKLYPHEARALRLNPNEVGESMAGRGQWEVPLPAACRNPESNCIGKMIAVGGAGSYRCFQCGFADFGTAGPPTVIIRR